MIVFLITSKNVGAAQIPQNAQEFLVNDFSGGMNTRDSEHKIPKNFSPLIQNFYVDELESSLVQRNGFILAGSTPTLSKVNFLFPFNKESGDAEFIVSDSSVVLTTKDFITYTLIKSSLNSTVQLQAAQVRNKVWFTNGSDPIFTWDGDVHQDLDGTGGKPNPPKGKYIGYFQERVFLGNTSLDGSALQFSALTTTAGVSIAPDDPRAWPAENELKIGQGDGRTISALDVFNGQMNIDKESGGIYTLFGTGVDSYFARKTGIDIGAISRDSIVHLDNLRYFLGKDGIYAFNGSDAQRISDLITPDVEKIRKDTVRTVLNTWSSQDDFSKGQFYGSTSPITGGVNLRSENVFVNTIDATPTDSPERFVTIFATGNAKIISTFTLTNFVSNDFLGHNIESIIYVRNRKIAGGGISLTAKFKNLRTGEESGTFSYSEPPQNNTVARASATFANLNPKTLTQFSGSDINLSSMIVTFTVGSNEADVFFPTVSGNATIFMNSGSTVQFISDVATITTITSWSSFEADFQTNTGEVSFFTRVAENADVISTQAWGSQPAGSRLNYSEDDKYIQWAATLTAISTNTPPIINNVNISHVEGSGADNRAVGVSWKNRIWLVVSTDAAGTYTPIYVKSKITNPNPNAWVKFIGMNLKSIAIFNDNLYGGSSSSGTIYRLDFGTNDNGLAIQSIYETPQIMSGWMDNRLFEIWTDSDKSSGDSFNFGISREGGAFSDILISNDGTGRLLNVVSRNDFGKFFKFRVRHSLLDKPFTFHGMNIVYVPMLTR